MFGLGACQSRSYREEGWERMGQSSRGLSHARPWEDWHSSCLIQTNQERCQAAPLGPTFSSTSETSPNAQFLKRASQVGSLGVGPERCIVLSPLPCICLYGVDACACVYSQLAHGFCLHLPRLELQGRYQTHQTFKEVLASVLTTNHLPSSGMCIFNR